MTGMLVLEAGEAGAAKLSADGIARQHEKKIKASRRGRRQDADCLYIIQFGQMPVFVGVGTGLRGFDVQCVRRLERHESVTSRFWRRQKLRVLPISETL